MRLLLVRKFILIIFLSLYSCGNNIPFPEERVLKRPVGLSVTANTGLTFTLRYFVQNQEPTFDGYDLFIKREPIGDSEPISGQLQPVNLTGTLPTFRHGPEDFEPSAAREVLVTTIDGVREFEAGFTYFFRLTAHSRRGFRSDPSNEVSAQALP